MTPRLVGSHKFSGCMCPLLHSSNESSVTDILSKVWRHEQILVVSLHSSCTLMLLATGIFHDVVYDISPWPWSKLLALVGWTHIKVSLTDKSTDCVTRRPSPYFCSSLSCSSQCQAEAAEWQMEPPTLQARIPISSLQVLLVGVQH